MAAATLPIGTWTTRDVLSVIMKGAEGGYSLDEFRDLDKPPEEILSIFPQTVARSKGAGKTKYYIRCFKRNTDIEVWSPQKSNPAEIVRQLYIYKLTNAYGYPLSRIVVHFQTPGGSAKPADLVVTTDDLKKPYIVIVVETPDRREGVDRLLGYLSSDVAELGAWSNGGERYIVFRKKVAKFEDTSLPDLPRADQTVSELLDAPLRLGQLRTQFDFRKVILLLEELVLANSGKDEFQELFKLIFAKLYDEKVAAERQTKEVEFRTHQSAQATYDNIEKLFEKASLEWKGIFRPNDRIELTPEHLEVCVPQFERLRLLGANMRIMDDAFEYLMSKVSKGAKGQYFTPRYVIDMCVKMLNPKKGEYVIDPACGSAGFLIHTMNWVRAREFPSATPARFARDYASKYLFGLDFEERAAKVARAMMLIAGDGRTHIFMLNALDPRTWLGSDPERTEARQALRPLAARRAANGRDDPQYWGDFNFDVLMTNPPFSGEIRQKDILERYDFAADALARPNPKEERDVLFLERSLQLLRPGGRMAIVLPQGKLNSPSFESLRGKVMERARILAVVGLHENTFKPHTPTKTSVLFLQKWRPDEEPLADYPIFMAASEFGGKDSRGGYEYLHDAFDQQGNKIINHDLDAIAEAFIEFAQKAGFDWWSEQ